MTLMQTHANLWTLQDHPGCGAAEWSSAQKVSVVAAAGFDGVTGKPG
jgi:hypothetical protein